MLSLGPVGFAAPWVLAGLLALPLLWLLLRAVPPPARVQEFPPVTLFGEFDGGKFEIRSIPWWLKLLRMLGIAAAIVGFAGPVLITETPDRRQSELPILILVDGSWAGADHWPTRIADISAILELGDVADTPVHLAVATSLPDRFSGFGDAGDLKEEVAALLPKPVMPNGNDVSDWIEDRVEGNFDSIWLTDGIAYTGHDRLMRLLLGRGEVTVIEPAGPVQMLGLPEAQAESVVVPLRVARNDSARIVRVDVIGADQSGTARMIDSQTASLSAGQEMSALEFRMPAQLRNRIERLEINGVDSAGAVSLVAGGLQRSRAALVIGRQLDEGGILLSPYHYLRRALSLSSELVEGGLEEMLEFDPDIMFLPDIVELEPQQVERLEIWVRDGGHLVRFAGRLLAASPPGDDDLYPVRLRAGTRSMGGSMSWEQPKNLDRFAPTSPFLGLEVSPDITVSRQILAQPGPDLADRVLASLEDGTPLITGSSLGDGLLVLFHIPATAEWSNLPLHGLFPGMLERLVLRSRTGPVGIAAPESDQLWRAEQLVDAFGRTGPAENPQELTGDRLASGDIPPGIYESGQLRMAVNAVSDPALLTMPSWPESVRLRSGADRSVTQAKGALLALAFLLLVADFLATFRLGGSIAVLAAAIPCALAVIPGDAAAELDDDVAIRATRETVLAYVITGDQELDRISEAGLRGLSRVVEARTSIELAEPTGLESSFGTVALYPLVYWPVSSAGPSLSEEAYRKLRTYLERGGMILFDTRDALLGGYSPANSNAEKLARMVGPLAIPPLDIPDRNHTISRSFYLLDRYPGRYQGDIWVEQSRATRGNRQAGSSATDGVTPVVIGGNDWASAWAVHEDGTAMFPVGAGGRGERQREVAYRFGINLIMHALSGNYKSDQLNVDALLKLRAR